MSELTYKDDDPARLPRLVAEIPHGTTFREMWILARRKAEEHEDGWCAIHPFGDDGGGFIVREDDTWEDWGQSKRQMIAPLRTHET